MDKGANCPKEGQDAVAAMQGKLAAAQNTKKAKDKAYNDALNTDVNFGTRKYSSLTKGQCGTFFNSAAYKNAETKVKSANTKAWTKAAHLKCVLDGKTTNQCTVP